MSDSKDVNLHRDMGNVEGRLTAVESTLTEVRTAQRETARDIGKELSEIKKVLNQAKGGWKTLLLAAGTAGVVGALLAKLGTLAGFVPK